MVSFLLVFSTIPSPYLFSRLSPDDGLSGSKYVVSGITNTFIHVTSPFLLASNRNTIQHYNAESHGYGNMLGDIVIKKLKLKLSL
jgi:hypothetical protein